MNAVLPTTTFLKDYQKPDFAIDSTHLKFELFEDYTLVTAKLAFKRIGDHQHALTLHGAELELMSLAVDGAAVGEQAYTLEEETLSLPSVPNEFTLDVVTKIYPQSNTSLEGLYRSRTMYCTQCEAEGFRKITYFLDRPDVLSVFTVTIEADKNQFPVLLSNGNCIAQGDLPDGRHFATWYDPFLKPCYLFALVAGDLACVEDEFITCTNRTIAIKIYVEEKDVNKCEHAITSLKNAMRWDEEVYGREYDLDIYMIVAVDDFNMGAMENKGLNIFNTSCVLASPATTTDAGYQRVEGVIAHEYFHNWSGNRVTCRDWFQLSLKEGFTVFRDEEFSADMGSRTVKRVEDVQLLRSLQFAEDAGPMAHPVRPASYIEISNFYTLTVYEKGAEVVRMIRTLIGEDAFRKGSDLYFEKHDGSAATIEDFISAMSEASGYDFSQFMHWYSQAGTPVLSVTADYDSQKQQATLTFAQHCPSTPEASAEEKQPMVIPINLKLLGENGPLALKVSDSTEVKFISSEECVVTLNRANASVTFDGIEEAPVPALLRGFSAPVKLKYDYKPADLMRIMSMEDDGFCRWDASEKLAIQSVLDIQGQQGLEVYKSLLEGFKHLLSDTSLDPAMVALMLQLPGEGYLGEQMVCVDVEGLHKARNTLKLEVANELEPLLWQRFKQTQEQLATKTGFSADVIALRSLKNVCLSYLMLIDNPNYVEACWQQFINSTVMSDEYCALSAIVHSESPKLGAMQQEALDTFYKKWQQEPLVINQWFAVQASATHAGALSRVQNLLQHPAYDGNNPNKIRSVVGVFCNQNLINFHQTDGSGYAFLADQIIQLNKKNPQIAARLVTPLSKWSRFDQQRQALMQAQLTRISKDQSLSKDVYEIVSKSLRK